MLLSMIAEVSPEILKVIQAVQDAHEATNAQQSHDAVWISLVTAIPPTLMALGAFIQSLRNGAAAALAATKAAEAAVKTEKVATDLKKNTELTEKARETAAIIQEQTNGMKERQDLVIQQVVKTVGENSTAIKLLQQKLAAFPVPPPPSSTDIKPIKG